MTKTPKTPKTPKKTQTLVDNMPWTPATADAAISRTPSWAPPATTVVAASKPKKRSTVATIPNLVPANEVDAAYAAKQRLENAEAEFKALTAAIKDAVATFAAGQATTVNVPGAAEIAAQVSVKRDTLALKKPDDAKGIAGPYFYKWFREEITSVNYVVPALAVSLVQQILALPQAQALLRAASATAADVLVEQRQAAYSVAEDWQRDQPLLAALLGGEDKATALQGCVEVDRRNGTSIRFVGREE